MRQEHRPGFSVVENRNSKALKIITVLEEVLGQGFDGLRVLDVGTGTGEIASILGQRAQVVSVDPVDSRAIISGYQYVCSETGLPFTDSSFDIVISNHVIEHLSDADYHLAELARVVRPTGVIYLATPNRGWPFEVHVKVFFLHWLPANGFFAVLRWMGRFHEPLWLLGWAGLQKRAKRHFQVVLWSDRILKNPRKYHFEVSGLVNRLFGVIPDWCYRMVAHIHPTLIVILRPHEVASLASTKSVNSE